jgi:ribosome-binding protein aMBF1 (putative translation factor)
MGKNYYLSGEFNLTCDRCSKKIKAHQAKHEWTGFIVCGDCYETRHPQDFVKAKTDRITVPFTRPIPPLVFVNTSYGTMYVDTGWVVTDYYEGTEL